MKRRYIFILLTLSIFLGACTNNNEGPILEPEKNNPPVVEVPELDPIEDIVKAMSLEEKIGQLFIIGLEGLEITDNEVSQIRDNKIGGFIFFKRNINNKTQVKNLINSLKDTNKTNKIPLFFSIDEEGGKVSRLSKIYTNLRDLETLGIKNDNNLSFEYGEIQGLKLASLGFNLNFAPVLDINSNPKNPVIGSRSIGSTAQIVADHGVEIINGLESVGIISAVKHFPGHGDTDVDSHLELPIVDKSYDDLEDLELVPFKVAVDKGADMVMISHILFPQIDDLYPASMSKILIQHILRDNFGFENVVISDDMTMGAIKENYTLEEASIKFLKGGGDILLICHGLENPNLVINRVKSAIIDNEISIEEIDSKVYRILNLKFKYNLDTNKILDLDDDDIDLKAYELNDKLK